MKFSGIKKIEKTPSMVARDLIKAIFNQGFYVQIRCMEERDLLQTPTAEMKKAFDAIFSVEGCIVEAVGIDPVTKERNVIAGFVCIDEGSGDDFIVNSTYSIWADRIIDKARA